MQRSLAGGNFNLTPEQTASSSGISDFIARRGDPAAFESLVAPLRTASARATDRGAASIRESFGLSGNRLSSSLAKTEGQFRNEAQTNLDAQIGQMFLQEQDRLLQALGLQNQFGLGALAPFMQFASQGINPDQAVVQDSPFVTALKAGGALLGAFANPASALTGAAGAATGA